MLLFHIEPGAEPSVHRKLLLLDKCKYVEDISTINHVHVINNARELKDTFSLIYHQQLNKEHSHQMGILSAS
jgi:hypothetical protein